MTKGHRSFHRRAARPAPAKLVTVNVQVIATVDANNGSLVAHETSPPALASPLPPSLAAASAPLLPSVPAVPPFPTDLSVPSVVPYPWPSGVAVVQAVGSSTASTLGVSAPTPSQTGVSQSPVPTTSPTSQTTPTSPLPSSLPSSLPSQHTFDSLASSSTPDTKGTPTASDPASSTVYAADGGAGDSLTYSPAPAAVTTGASSHTHAGSTPTALKTPKVVGSVIGSLAGAAFILAILLLLIRRHKRKKGGALQLAGEHHQIDSKRSTRQAPRYSNAIPASFLNRFSTMSRSTVETTLSGGERSFQKVSGRKLPSAFSEGMTSEQFSRSGPISSASFYPDEKDKGIYAIPNTAKDFEKEIGDTATVRESAAPMNIRPGPARTPVIRHPNENPFADLTYLSPPQTPNMGSPRGGSLGRSLHSADGSRSSRFTENV